MKKTKKPENITPSNEQNHLNTVPYDRINNPLSNDKDYSACAVIIEDNLSEIALQTSGEKMELLEKTNTDPSNGFLGEKTITYSGDDMENKTDSDADDDVLGEKPMKIDMQGEKYSAAKHSNRRKKAGKIAKIGMLSALACVLYLFVKFPLPFFPSFLEIQISDIPALIATFSMGVPSGLAVHTVKILLKLPFTGTAYVGEIMDFIIGLLYIIPCGLIYKKIKTQKGAIIGLLFGSLLCTLGSMLMNWLMAIPLYLELLFDGSWRPLIEMCKVLFPNITVANFYTYYIFGSVLPFNLLRCLIVDIITVLLYKRVSNLFKKF